LRALHCRSLGPLHGGLPLLLLLLLLFLLLLLLLLLKNQLPLIGSSRLE